ncbi:MULTISPECIES: zf-TFIIB domain-containing protein [unclassified Curtobacterium]|uniref:TFIIB-type zinc ribbon-containing protein n=1 Tax=unclassified Curtobacterium TaxID=257496 RepID=UPI00382EEE50
MQCPNDQATLVMSERSGIEIDYCPECRGVWLDRGELDKIIDRAAPTPSAAPAPAPAPGPHAVPGVPAAPAYGSVPGYSPGMAVPRNGYASPGSPGSPGSWDKGRRGGYGQPGYGQPGYGQPGHGQQPYGRKRRGNWLSELFD